MIYENILHLSELCNFREQLMLGWRYVRDVTHYIPLNNENRATLLFPWLCMQKLNASMAIV